MIIQSELKRRLVTHNSSDFNQIYRQTNKLIDCYGSHNLNKLSINNISSIILFYDENELPIIVVIFDGQHHLYDYTITNDVQITGDDIVDVVKRNFYIDNIVKDCSLDDIVVYYKR